MNTAERLASENRVTEAADAALRADHDGVVIVWDRLRGRSAHGPARLYWEAWGTIHADGRAFRVIVSECVGDEVESSLRRMDEAGKVGALVPEAQRGELRAAAACAYRAMRKAQRAEAFARAGVEMTKAPQPAEPAPAVVTVKPAIKLEFFSGSEALGNESGSHGYDGSMAVASFAAGDLPELLKRMDCVCGPCLVIVTTAEGFKSAWPCVRESDA